MNKYKTLDSPAADAQLEENIQERLRINRKAKATLQSQNIDQLPMSENKSIIFIKLPNKNYNQLNSFRSSLYESSLKRLKQQKVTLLKESVIPCINSRKTYETFEEEAIKRALKDTGHKKKQTLPNLHKLIGQQTRRQYSYFEKSKDKSEEEILQSNEGALNLLKSEVPQRKSTFEVDSSMLGYKNLKEKYLELRQLSLMNQKRSELLDKPQYRRYDPDRNLEQYDSKIKMEKIILEHMNRYNKKDLFQTKVNGFKTTIYPHEKAHIRQEEETNERKRAFELNRKHEHIQNFVRKKRRGFNPTTTISQYPHSSFEVSHGEGQYPNRMLQKPPMNPERLERLIECTPWETDADF